MYGKPYQLRNLNRCFVSCEKAEACLGPCQSSKMASFIYETKRGCIFT